MMCNRPFLGGLVPQGLLDAAIVHISLAPLSDKESTASPPSSVSQFHPLQLQVMCTQPYSGDRRAGVWLLPGASAPGVPGGRPQAPKCPLRPPPPGFVVFLKVTQWCQPSQTAHCLPHMPLSLPLAPVLFFCGDAPDYCPSG